MSQNFDKPYLYVGGVGAGNYYDFRDRMLGYSFEKRVAFSELTTWTARITLDNDDGAFTPRTTGTYAGLNWFNQLVSITPYANFSTGGGAFWYDTVPFASMYEQFFVGIVDGFDIMDDGTSSTVELTLVDFLTVAGRAPSLPSLTDPVVKTQSEVVQKILDVMTTEYFNGTTSLPVPPGFNANNIDIVTINRNYGDGLLSSQSASLEITDVDLTGNVADALAESILPSQSCLLIPAVVTLETNPTRTKYECLFIGPDGIKSTSQSGRPIFPQYEFVEGGATGSQIPFTQLDVGYQLDKLINSVQATNVSTSTDVEAFDTASIIANGGRNASYTALICTTTAQAQRQVDRLVNRYSTPRYFPRTLTTTRAAIRATGLSGTRDAVADLLQIDGLWTRVSVTYTPTGHSTPITDLCIISAITVEAVPGDMVITFELIPQIDNSSFVLDSSTLGVLDQNRLG